MESDRAFMFHMCIPCGKCMSVVLRSRSSVMVKYQGHISHNIMNESKNRYTYHKSLNAVFQPGNCQFSLKFGRWQLGDRHRLQAAVCHRLMFSNYAYRQGAGRAHFEVARWLSSSRRAAARCLLGRWV